MAVSSPRLFSRRATLCSVGWLGAILLAFPTLIFASPDAATGLSHAASTLPASGEATTGGSTLLNLLVVALLVLANGFFVASEFALVAVRKTRIDQLAAEGSGAAVVVQNSLKNLDKYIAATQVGITVASLILGGVGEKTFHHLFEPLFGFLPETGGTLTRGTVAIGLAYFVMTALHVIIGELMPKSIALQNAEKTALFIGRPMTLVAKVFAPMIWLLNGSGGFLLRLIGIHSSEGHGEAAHSPEELDLLVAQSHQGGELNDTEAEILHRVVRFSDLTLREVMVPRTEIQGLPVEMPRLALRAWIHSQPHSRVPVYVGSMDEVIGIVHLKDMVPFAAKWREDDEKGVSLMPLVREAARLPETATVDQLLGVFKRRRQQMAVVLDEYGGTAGIVTLGDLLEQVFGEVADEFDTPEAEIAARNDGRIALAGRTLIDEINHRYGTGFRSEEADTLAGLILTELGRVAKVGDEVAINGALLRVEAIERLRITRLSLLLPVKTEDGTAHPIAVGAASA